MKYTLLILIFIANTSYSKVLLKDIGIIGLASHDLFAWDRKNEVNTENGRLDLSTIFDYTDGKRWKKGGNPKNGENSPVWTITKNLVNFYKEKIKTMNSDEARILTVNHFHSMVKESYERLTEQSFPETTINQMVTNTNTEQV
jgi:hypothetical protein